MPSQQITFHHVFSPLVFFGVLVLVLSPPSVMGQATAKQQAHPVIKGAPVQSELLDFDIENKTGYALSGLYLSPANQNDWSDNLLEEVLDDEEIMRISFAPEHATAKWDLRADWLMSEDEDEPEYVYWTGLSLNDINKLILYYNESTRTPSAETE